MLPFLILFIILAILVVLYRTKSPFWKLQPVYHMYNPFNYIHGTPHVIRPDPVEINRYFNRTISCTTHDKLDENTKTQFLSLIQQHFLNTKEVYYSPTPEELFSYFECHNAPSYISLFMKDEKLVEEKKANVILDTLLVGAISSRPLAIEFTNKEIGKLPIYYVDHLCVHSKFRNQNIAPQLIQTHERLRRIATPNIRISLFRRDVTLSSIMPFTIFDCHVFETKMWLYPPLAPGFFKLTQIDEGNIHLLYESMQLLKSSFDCIIHPDISHVLHLIRLKIVHIYVAQVKNDVLGIYFFRNSSTYFNNGKAGECFGSMLNKKYNIKDSIVGFQYASFECAKSYTYRNMLYDDTSDNKAYIDHLLTLQKETYSFKCAYYFYNFLIHTKSSSKVFIFH